MNTLIFLARDCFFVFILRIFWEPFSLKRSHWWHWRNYLGPIDEELTVLAKRDPDAKSRKGFWANLYQTNFGWQKIVIVSPVENIQFLVGFYSVEENKRQICTLVNRKGSDVGLLVGPYDCRFFARSLDGRQVKLKFVGENRKFFIRRFQKRPNNFRLL